MSTVETLTPSNETPIQEPKVLFSVLEMPDGSIDFKVVSEDLQDPFKLESMVTQLQRGIFIDNIIKIVEQRFDERAKLMMEARRKQQMAAAEAAKLEKKIIQ